MSKPFKILVIANPRSGTKYASKVLQAMGLDVGHEQMKKDGGCGYQFAAAEWRKIRFAKGWRPSLSEFTWVQTLIRDPMDCIGSMMGCLNEHHLEHQCEHSVMLGSYVKDQRVNLLTKWAYAWYQWNCQCEALMAVARMQGCATEVHKVEDQEWWINIASVQELNAGLSAVVPRTSNHRRDYKKLTWERFRKECLPEVVALVEVHARQYGYLEPSYVFQNTSFLEDKPWSSQAKE